MKIIVNRFYITLIYLLGIFIAFAKPGPPAPNFKRPPPPPGLPIDENILFLLVIALLFGIYIIYKQKINIKTPA
ncbi:hypothetical protein [Flavobacterium sp.]|uniref:hypothetical protein n=1 Tax=Flavobacterium sp. TaxID=239 RepID=UPI00286E6ED4|nr:hypothetical protein [Flavobacterium sp.]